MATALTDKNMLEMSIYLSRSIMVVIGLLIENGGLEAVKSIHVEEE
jgi:hypothetical protein